MAYYTIHSGIVSSGIVLNSGDVMDVLGGTVYDTTINSGGEMEIEDDSSIVDGVTVNAGGYMEIEGGVVKNLNWTPCVGEVDIKSGASVSFAGNIDGVYFGSNDVLLSHAQTMNGKKVTGDMCVMNGGIAYNTVVRDGGDVIVYQGGKADGITIDRYGLLNVLSGGTATNVNWTPCVGYMEYDTGATVTFTSQYSGVYYGSNGSLLSNTQTMNDKRVEDCDCYVMSGGVANRFVVTDDGWLVVSGGTANSTTLNDGGEMEVLDGGVINHTLIDSDAEVYIKRGGTANNTTLQNGGEMDLDDPGCSATNTLIKSGSELNIRSYTFAYNTTVECGGHIDLEDFGTATDSIINGQLSIGNGAVHCGTMTFGEEAYVYIDNGARIDFTLAGRTAADGYLINNLSKIHWYDGAPDFSVTVSADQAEGTYKLAQKASGFSEGITIGTDGSSFGSLTVNGDALKVNGMTYELNNVDGNLTLTIMDGAVIENTPVFAYGKFNGSGGVFELTANGTGYIRNIHTKTQISGTFDASGWELVGVGDFNGSGSDGLLWQEKATGYVYMQNDLTTFDEIKNKQYCLGVIGEGYKILDAGDFTGKGINGVVMQGPAFGDSSVSRNYGLPIWGREADGATFNGWLGTLVNTWQHGNALKGNTSDQADINAKNYMYEVVSVGDYNGDGVDDVMLQNIMPTSVYGVTITGSGDVFTFLTGDINNVKAGAAPTVAYAGCATDGWEVIGSGDFDGDGIDDTLLSDGSGVAGWKMANGQRCGDFLFGSLALNEEIAGIADLNGDGTDDIIVLNTATDAYTGWLVNNGSVFNTATIA